MDATSAESIKRGLQTIMEPNPSRRLTILSAAISTLMVGLLLAQRSLQTGLWCDELLFLRAVELGPWEGLMSVGSSHPPLARWILTPWAGAALPDWALRLPSLVASLATIWVWRAVMIRLIDDAVTISLLLPAMALNVAWLAIGYQLVPYALFTLLASLHALAWLRMLSNPGRGSTAFFVLTGVACVWTHFYGLNLLVADQLVWLLLLLRRRAAVRTWIVSTIAMIILTLPLIPILRFYLDLESRVTILKILDYPAYFWQASAELFSRTTLFGIRVMQPVWLLWLGIAALTLWTAWKSHRKSKLQNGNSDSTSRPGPSRLGTSADAVLCEGQASTAGPLSSAACKWSSASIACGLFLAGLPATQAHSILSGEAMWERYAMAGMWIHWPLVVMWLGWAGGRWSGRAVAAAALVAGLLVLRMGTAGHPLFTRDYRPVVDHVRSQHQVGDAFLTQNVDIWSGAANFERLWFDRYLGLDMPLVSGPTRRRYELFLNGYDLDGLDPSVRRVWVHTLLFDEAWFESRPVPGWRVEKVWKFGRNYPLVLYVRQGSVGRLARQKSQPRVVQPVEKTSHVGESGI